MLFILYTFSSGIFLVILSLVIERYFRSSYKISKKIFWQAGLWNLFFSFMAYAVITKIPVIFEGFNTLSPWVQALCLGLISGFSLELGRFVVLDRLMAQVRSFKETVYFGVSWAGLNAFLMGILLIINSFGMYTILPVENFETEFPRASKEQVELLQETQKIISEIISKPAVEALFPFTENLTAFPLSIAFSLLALLAVQKGQTRFVWFGFILHAFLSSLVYFILMNKGENMNIIAQLVMLISSIFALIGIKNLAKQFK